MKKILRVFIITSLLFGFAGAVIFQPSLVSAQSTATGNGIKLFTIRSELTMNPGESRTVTLRVQNITGVTSEFKAVVNDMVPKGELGQPALILEEGKFAPSHSLKRYVSPIPNFTLDAGAYKDLKVTVSMPKDIPAGGYYGAIRFVGAGDGIDKNVTLSASVASIMLVRVNGDITENTVLKSIDVRYTPKDATETRPSSFFVSNKDLYAHVRFENKGDSHVQPYGKIVVKKGSKVVQQTEINDTNPRGNVLPGSVRRFAVKLDKVGSFGKYTVEGNFGYGSSGQLISGKTSFLVIPLLYIVIGVVLIAGIVFAIFGLPRAIKRYNEKVVRRANRRR